MAAPERVDWVQPPEPIRGLDHLGVQAPCIALYAQLLGSPSDLKHSRKAAGVDDRTLVDRRFVVGARRRRKAPACLLRVPRSLESS